MDSSTENKLGRRDRGIDFSERIIGDSQPCRNVRKDEFALILKIENLED
jgi:hypothetical protein